MNKMAISKYLSIIILNVNGINALIKRHRVAEWIQKQDPYVCYLQGTHFRSKDTHRLKVKGWKRVFHVKENEKKAGVAILTSDKIDFKIKTVTRDKEEHYIMIKRSIQQEDITIVNIYVPNREAPQCIKQILMNIKGEVDSNAIIVGNFYIPLTSMDRSSRQKINKEALALNDTLDQMDYIRVCVYVYIYNIPSKSSRIHILFNCTWNILQDRSCDRPQNKPW